MPAKINGDTYYRTSEVCQMVGISRNTLFRWLKKGIIKSRLRDRRDWRLFTEDDVRKLQAEAGRIEVEEDLLGVGSERCLEIAGETRRYL